MFPKQCTKTIKKKPSEYLKQIYVDTIVFNPEALRHLIAVVGAGQVVLGTDYPFPWAYTPVDDVMSQPGLSDAERIAMLGGTMSEAAEDLSRSVFSVPNTMCHSERREQSLFDLSIRENKLRRDSSLRSE